MPITPSIWPTCASASRRRAAPGLAPVISSIRYPWNSSRWRYVRDNHMKQLWLPLLASGAVFLARGAEVKVPFEKYKLKNGLRVILSQDNSVPVVTVYVLYGVG